MGLFSTQAGSYSLLPTTSTDVLSQMATHSASVRATLPSTNPISPSRSASPSASQQPKIELDARRRPSTIPLLVFARRTKTGYHVLFAVVFLLVGTSLIGFHYLPDLLGTSLYEEDFFDERPTVNYPPNITFVPPLPPDFHHPSLGGTVVLPSDPTHILVPDHLEPAVKLLQPISTRLPHDLLDYYYTYGHLPPKTHPETAPSVAKVDTVHLWVNATSPFFQAEFEKKGAAENQKGMAGKMKHWRDNGELRGALRSAAESLRDGMGTLHVISGDFEFDADASSEVGQLSKRATGKEWRIGQIPRWLNWGSQHRWMESEGQRGLRWHFHSSIFRLPRDDDGSLPEGEWSNEEEWRKEALPTFNSFGIETRVGFVPGLSEEFILSNDDMFMLNPLSNSDFHNPLLGTVLRFDPSLLVRPVVTPDLLSTSGEWGGLQHANALLSQRFPTRSRFYMHHLPKALTRSIVQEASIMFAKDLSLAATRGFRESKRGEGDVEMAWLVGHLRIERWREALLWSWVVAKVGGVEGVWGEGARQEVKKILGGDLVNDGDLAVIRRKERRTLSDLEDVMGQAGWEMPKSTTYVFSSMDGHLPIQPSVPIAQTSCTFQLSICLPPSFLTTMDEYPAVDIFKSLAFTNPSCGDCLIDALVNASGERGLHAFLPKREAVFYPSNKARKQWERSEPILPLSSSWEKGEFALDDVVSVGQDLWAGSEIINDGGVRLRDWCIKLLSRYTYTYAQTPSRFSMIHSALQLHTALKSLDKSPEISLVCLNDDQPDTASAGTGERFDRWMRGKWGGKNEWVDWENEDWSKVEISEEEEEASLFG